MSETELGTLSKILDEAIGVYRDHAGPLRGPEISVKSMLMVLRLQIAGQITAMKVPAEAVETRGLKGGAC